jgi:hypothetical protein
MMADVNGNGRADIVGFGENQIEEHLGQADWSFIKVVGGASDDGPVYTKGWRIEEHSRIMADVNGDGKADIVGFGNSLMYVWLGQSDGKFVLGSSLPRMTANAGGWNVTEHPLMVADVNGDGRADIVGFGGLVKVHLVQADGSFTEVDGNALNDGPDYTNGWRIE